MPDMLLEAVRARAEKQTEFGYGIMTADRYVKNMQDFVGLDICYDYASTRQMSFDDAMQKARKTLVYSNPDMVVLEKAKSASLEGITLPKNTLMVFKHVLTTPRKDRDGDILRTEGAMPDPRMLLLWQHVHTLPIGKMLAITEHNSKRLTLLSCIVDMNELSHDAAVMVDNDMARFSHGFRALEFNQMKENESGATGAPGYEVTKFEILEESIVSVPSNADAEVEEVMMGLISTGKLTSPLMKEYGRAIRSRMPVMIASGISLNKGSEDGEAKSAGCTPKETHADREQAGDGTEKDGSGLPEVKRVLCGIKAFDVDLEHLEASKLEYEWASRWLDCQIKEMEVISTFVPHFRKGSFLTGLKHEEEKWTLRDTRNLTRDGKEEPPSYQVVQLNSRMSDTFLTSGIKFYLLPDGNKLCLKFCEGYGGVSVLTYVKRGNPSGTDSIDKAWDFARTNNFLKGEAFSLVGNFIKRGETQWDEVFLEDVNKKTLQRTVRLLNDQKQQMPNRGIIVMGPPGCLHADTPIYDPITKTTETVEKRFRKGDGFHVFAKSSDGCITISEAEAPWKYDPADMVRIRFASGREFRVTKGHRFLLSTDRDDYATAEQLIDRVHAGQVVALPTISLVSGCHSEFALSHQGTNEEYALSAHEQGAQHWTKTTVDCPNGYSLDFHQYDEPLHEAAVFDLVDSQLLVDAQQHSHVELHLDDLVVSNKCIDQASFCHHASLDCLDHSAVCFANVSVSDAVSDIYGQCADLSQSVSLSVRSTVPIGTAVCSSRFLIDPKISSAFPNQSMGTPETVLDTIVEIEEIGKHSYYDFHVPVHENYWADGCFHHNTGKTLSGRVILNESKASFIWVAAKDFWKMGAVDGLCAAFELANELAPAVIFMEDVDNWLSSYAVDVIKTEMDGIGKNSGVVTILTTNYPERFPDALIDRPGRFHDVLMFDLPNERVRRDMLLKWAGSSVKSMTLDTLIKQTEGYSGAHLYELVYFAKTLQTEDVEMDLDTALVKAVEKIDKQRALLDQNQLAGSNFRNSRSLPAKVKEYMASLVECSATVEVKSGRKLSSANAKLLQDCVDDLQSCVDNDKDMSRGSQAICERCVNRLNKVMGSAESSDEGKTAPVTVAEPAVLTTKEAMTLFLTKSSESEQRQMFGVLQTLLNVNEKSRQVQEFKSFLGK